MSGSDRLVRGIALLAAVAALASACAAPSEPGDDATVSPPATASPSPGPSSVDGDAGPPVDPDVELPWYGFYGILHEPAVALPRATLTDQYGDPYRLRKPRPGRVSLLYFGYTHCPDICPSELATVAAAVRDLPPAIAAKVRMHFVTVDPARDTVARMRRYVALFDPGFVGLRGPDPTVRRLQISLGLQPAERFDIPDDGYVMSHSAEVLAFTDDGLAHLTYPFGVNVVQWRHDLWKLIQQGWS